jgi:ribosome-binding protein aMBF1 (putative translation factor)
MTSDKEPEQEQQAPQRRGEAAWKAHKDRISASNDAARRAGKAAREAREQAAIAKRLAEERRIDAALIRAHEAHQAHRPTG